ncbi:putative RNA-binding protein (Nab3) [Aspergillus clavatus NRRL 1]|uniref:RNA-binding protein (Nab3), putative n=1 Tax=Aspergillus clavatus (strain ATCC 1007 / CBS 513.65 / DSM 816 / NCTC 3887 / NRRL 1 / QM 1276 / 107) TaxID=344612 RepID=A1CK76_ASPCL|nr:RNA-binding protein (Nab3), putative [Aspergillus clavatus NRRL 1]EAW09550.1 RNA-binding protein (Nab3), putative [Aspergillus clavatus NRRL 1]
MTPGSPDEALHFRGKTLTPESPRPLHVAEPTKIPVLQNQMDPVFNDTSTYYETPQSDFENGSQAHHYHSGQYAESGDGRRYPGSMSGLSQHHHYQPSPSAQSQGSFHTGFSQAGDRFGRKNGTSLSAGITTAKPSLPSDRSPITAENSSTAQGIAGNPSLTAFPPSDPAALLAHSNSSGVAPSSSSSWIAQNLPVANEVTHAVNSWAAQHDRLDSQAKPDDNTGEAGVDFQNLLDNLPPPSTGAPSAPTISETAPASADDVSEAPQSLPPRPPPQEKPSIHPNYSPTDDIRSYHQLHPHAPSTSSTYPSQQSNSQNNRGLPASLTAAGAPGTVSASNTLLPPPGPSFQQPLSAATDSQEPPTSAAPQNGRAERPPGRLITPGDEDVPWGPDVQKKYDEFLHDERVYVTEGLWDRFPAGSRLFVGNLPTERVTKRDLFHIFHQYGKLAQISIKQAYGFIQFVDASACKHALDCEQGAVIRGRKIHLEISKPQRNTRAGPAPPAPRRSRSPEYSRGGPPSSRNPRGPGDRYERPYDSGRVPFSDFRDEPTHRRRDDYRPPPRSPSPRPFRARDEYRSRDRTPERYDRRERRRSRSPYGRDRRYRSPSPRGRNAYDGDADLPVPRRAPRDVPEVQILVLEEVDRNFIFHVENSFRNRGLRVDVLVLGPRIPLNAAVQRQINEGVLAVVRLSRPNQFSRKIPLQLFDRSGGADNVRFNEYPEVEPNIAAEIVFHAQAMQRGAPPVPNPFPANPAFAVPTLPAAPIPQAPLPTLPNSNVANMISSLDGPTLQSLLSALQQRPPLHAPAAQPSFPAANVPPTAADLASLLSGVARQPMATNPPPHLPSQAYLVPASNAPVVPDPNLISLLTKGLGGHQHSQQQNPAAMAPQVQNIMNQLSKWKQ